MARCGCGGSVCSCALAAHPNAVDLAVTGNGSAGSPYLVNHTPTPSSDPGNVITVGSDGRLHSTGGAVAPAHAASHLPGGSDPLWLPHREQAGEAAPYPLPWAGDSVVLADRVAAFTFFEARLSLTAVKFRVLSGAAAPATGSPARLGLYTVDGTGALALVAQTAAGDTATLSAANTFYEPAIAADGAGAPLASFAVVRGQLYAVGIWTDSNGAGTARGYNGFSAAAVNRDAKRARVRSAVDAALPAAVSAADMTDSATAPWAAVAA